MEGGKKRFSYRYFHINIVVFSLLSNYPSSIHILVGLVDLEHPQYKSLCVYYYYRNDDTLECAQ